MKSLLTILIFLITPLVFCEVSSTSDTEEVFECNPPPHIKNRVNAHCIPATDIALDYKKKFEIKSNNKTIGSVSVSSRTNNEDGSVRLEFHRMCDGNPIPSVQTFYFCGYSKSNLDRTSAATKAVREGIAKDHGLKPLEDQKKIDDLMAQELNPWLADPNENILEKNGQLIIKSLQQTDGTTCYAPKDLTYKLECK